SFVFLWQGASLFLATPDSLLSTRTANHGLMRWMFLIDLWDLLVGILFFIPHISRQGSALWGDFTRRDLDDDQLKDAEFALAMGGGIDLAVASSPEDFIQTVGLDLRYTLGLTDAFDVSGDPEARNHAFLAAITVGF